MRTAAIAFWLISAFVLASDYVGPGEIISYPAAWITFAVGFLAGLACWFLPWQRFRPEWFLVVIGFGLANLVLSMALTGGVHSHLLIIYPLVVVFAGAVLEFRIAALVTVATALTAVIPLLGGWDGYYARSFLVLLPGLWFCA
jgi:hypothetical protein